MTLESRIDRLEKKAIERDDSLMKEVKKFRAEFAAMTDEQLQAIVDEAEDVTTLLEIKAMSDRELAEIILCGKS